MIGADSRTWAGPSIVIHCAACDVPDAAESRAAIFIEIITSSMFGVMLLLAQFGLM